MQNKLIAVTGGIGSGKTEAIEIIKSMGYSVFSLDKIYSDLLKNFSFLQEVCRILKVFPIKDENGNWTFDHRAAAENAFTDGKIKAELNAFTHPEIMKEFYKRAECEEGAVFCEVPLLYESGIEKDFDFVIVITRPLEERFKGIISRDGLSREEIEKRINNQFDYTNLRPNEHTIVIENDGSPEVLGERVKSAVEKITF